MFYMRKKYHWQAMCNSQGQNKDRLRSGIKTKTAYFVLLFHSLALSLHKIGCTRQFVSELTLRSFALSLQSEGFAKG